MKNYAVQVIGLESMQTIISKVYFHVLRQKSTKFLCFIQISVGFLYQDLKISIQDFLEGVQDFCHAIASCMLQLVSASGYIKLFM